MVIATASSTRWNRFSVGAGAAVWALVLCARSAGWVGMSDPQLLVLLALWVIAPLALPLTFLSLPTECSRLQDLSRVVLFLQPIAALVATGSFLLRPGFAAAAVASMWLLFTGLAALVGAIGLVRKGRIGLADTCLSLALVYLPVGGVWLALDRSGLRPLGFSPVTVQLTAVHFHFITLAALTIAGLTGWSHVATWGAAPRVIYRVAALGMLVSPLLVATGITLTRLTGVSAVESAAAVLLALSMILIALIGLRYTIPATTSPLARGLLIVSYASVVVTMVLAGAYALGPATGAWAISIPQMIATHGWLNAVAFGLCGLLGWRLRQDQGLAAEDSAE